MQKRLALWSAALLAAGWLPGGILPAAAAPIILISENFESYTADTVLNGLNPGDGNTYNWFTANLARSGFPAPTSRVVAASSTGGSGDNENALRIEAWLGSDHSVRFGRRFPEDITLTSGTPEITFTWKHRYGGGSNDQIIGIESISGGWLGALRLVGSGVRYNVAALGVGSDWSSTVFTFNTTDWYEITIHADISTQQWNFSIVNLNDPNNSYSIADRSFIANVQDARRIYSENRSGIYGASSFYMDDILVTAIPEPGSLALLLLAGTLGITIRRRL